MNYLNKIRTLELRELEVLLNGLIKINNDSQTSKRIFEFNKIRMALTRSEIATRRNVRKYLLALEKLTYGKGKNK